MWTGVTGAIPVLAPNCSAEIDRSAASRVDSLGPSLLSPIVEETMPPLELGVAAVTMVAVDRWAPAGSLMAVARKALLLAESCDTLVGTGRGRETSRGATPVRLVISSSVKLDTGITSPTKAV